MGAHIRWQAIIALLGIALLVSLLGYLAFSFTTVTVPDQGGTYVEGLAGNPQYINPTLCQYSQVDSDLASLVFSGLTDVNERGEIVNDVAESYSISEDGLTYTFRLRHDVRWQDGTALTAADVVFTIEAIQDADYQGVPHLAELWQNVQVEKIDDYTVQFTLPEPFTPFLDYTTIGLLPYHVLKDVPARLLPMNRFSFAPVGSGPFRVEVVSARKAVLSANPYFYGPKPYLTRLEFKFYPDYESLFSAYERGEIEGISYVRPEDLPKIRGTGKLTLFSARLSGYAVVLLNLNNSTAPFFGDKEVRQALLYALDRQKIIDHVLAGQGLVAHSPIMPDSWAYFSRLKHYCYDPAQASELLDEAGWVDADGDGVRENEDGRPLEFSLLTNDDPTRVKIVEEIARQWMEVGVRANPQKVGISGLVRDFLRPRRFEAALIEWGELPPDPDPYPMWHSTQTEGEGQNYSGFAHSQADEIMEEGRRIPDQARRIELYHRFQEIFAEQVPSLLLYYPVYNYAVDNVVKGIQLGPLTEPHDRFRHIAQWYMATRRVIVSEVQQRVNPGPAFDKSAN